MNPPTTSGLEYITNLAPICLPESTCVPTTTMYLILLNGHWDTNWSFQKEIEIISGDLKTYCPWNSYIYEEYLITNF
jgi:hypothetical protein